MKRIFLPLFTSAALAAAAAAANLPQPSVLIQGAMPSEVATLKAACKSPREQHIGPYEFTHCRIGRTPVIIAKTLVGETNAAISSALALREFAPISLLINQGTAGAHDENLHRGEVIVGTKIYNFAAYLTPRVHQHALANREKMRAPLRLGDEGTAAPEYYESAAPWVQKALAAAAKLGASARAGTIASSDAFNREAETIAYAREAYASDAEEMEAIASAQAAAAFGVPFLAVRVISNNERTGEDFDESTAQIAQKIIIQMLKTEEN